MKLSTTAALAGLLVFPAGTASAYPLPASPDTSAPAGLEQVQYRPYAGRGYGGGFGGPRYYAAPPRYYAPRFAGSPRFYAPRGYAGRPYWFARSWNPRPYYGTIIGGVALGTVLGVAAYGYAPPRPAPNLCWYWADEEGSRGYWDYCS